MKLSEHILSCQKMLEKFGDGDVQLPSSGYEDFLLHEVCVVHHAPSDSPSYYTLRKSFIR